MVSTHRPTSCSHAEAGRWRAGAARACAAGTGWDGGSTRPQACWPWSHAQALEEQGWEESGPPTPGHCVLPLGAGGGWSWSGSKTPVQP